jgi:subtilisin family serine protease
MESVRLFAMLDDFPDATFRLDTGIYIQHHEFSGRAWWGATFGGYNNADDNGHGTAAASLAVGDESGTATGSHAIAVKVSSDAFANISSLEFNGSSTQWRDRGGRVLWI